MPKQSLYSKYAHNDIPTLHDRMIKVFETLDNTTGSRLLKHNRDRYEGFLKNKWVRYTWKEGTRPRQVVCAYCELRTFPKKFYMKVVPGRIFRWEACVNCVEGEL